MFDPARHSWSYLLMIAVFAVSFKNRLWYLSYRKVLLNKASIT